MLGKHVKEFIQHLPPELKAETEFVQDYLKQEKEVFIFFLKKNLCMFWNIVIVLRLILHL